MNLKRIFFPACISLILFSGCSDNKNKIPQKTTLIDKKAISIIEPKKVDVKYPITLNTVKNGDIKVEKIEKGFSFSSAKGKAVLLSFFTSWCPPCKAEIPHLNTLQTKYKDNLEIISVLLEEKSEEDINKFLEKYKISFTVTSGKSNFDIAKAVGDVKAIPFMILYDKDGKYATHYVGAVPEEMMNVDIEKVVKQ